EMLVLLPGTFHSVSYFGRPVGTSQAARDASVTRHSPVRMCRMGTVVGVEWVFWGVLPRRRGGKCCGLPNIGACTPFVRNKLLIFRFGIYSGYIQRSLLYWIIGRNWPNHQRFGNI